jgi:hypothetical protein
MFLRRLLLFVLLLLAMLPLAPAKGRQATLPPVAFTGPGRDTDPEAGLPLIHNYHPRAYASATSFVDNWAVLQDPAGRIFIGNTGGALIYNGVNWQYVETPTKSIIRSLADARGRVYAGASDDLGYLGRDAAGKLRFVSLLPHLPAQHRAFGDVSYTAVTPTGVYFLTAAHLFRWDGKRMHRHAPDTRFLFMQWVRGKLYVQQAQRGLFVLENDELQPFAPADPFTKAPWPPCFPRTAGNCWWLPGARGCSWWRETAARPSATRPGPSWRNTTVTGLPGCPTGATPLPPCTAACCSPTTPATSGGFWTKRPA